MHRWVLKIELGEKEWALSTSIRMNSFCYRLLAVSLAMMAVDVLHAQTLTADTMVVSERHLQEVMVVDNRRQRVVSSTAPLHLLGRRDMLQMGLTDMADALHRLPGITLRDYGGAGGMKTVAVRGFGAKHTGVSYDGVMLSECQSGEIDLSRYSLENVHSLMLVVGDNDDIFIPARHASVPAVLHLRTLGTEAADRQPRLTAQMKVGSFGHASPFVRYEQSVSDALALSLAGEYTYADNDYPYRIQNVSETVSDRRRNSRMNAGHAEMNFLWRMNAVSSLGGKLYYYDNDRQLPGPVHYYSNTSKETLRERNAFGQMTWQTHLDDRWQLRLLGKVNWAASLYDDGLTAGQIQDANYYQREAYAAACLLFRPNGHWAMDYSADYAFNNLNSSLKTDVRPYRHTVLQTLTAKYQTARWTVTGRLLHSLYQNGARDGESARDENRLSPSLSMSWRLTEGWRLRASWKEIFRAPTFNESYFFHYGSTNLKAETTQQFNLGMTWQTGEARPLTWLATVDGYYNKVNDMIVAVPYNMFVWTCVNVGRVQVLGLDATLRAEGRLGGGHTLTATGNYTFQQVRNRTNEASPYYNNQIAYTPKHSGAVSLSWENPWVNLSWHLTAVSHRWTNNEHLDGTRIAGYDDMGVTLYRRLRLKHLALEPRLDVKNLLDRQYEIVGAYPMPGISWLFALKVNY